MNYGELKIYLSAYVNRTDLTDALYDTWADIVQTRLQRDGRLIFLDRAVQIANPAGDVIYPFDTGSSEYMESLLSISVDNVNGAPRALKKVSWEEFTEAQAAGVYNGNAEPAVYVMFSSGIKIAPGDQADYVFNIVFRALDLPLAADGSSNTYLTYASDMFISAMLMEIYKYLRDVEGEGLATQRYESEVKKYLDYYAWQHSGANQSETKGAWSWV